MIVTHPVSCILLTVIDNFALFEESRRPWLAPDSLKAKFIAYSAACHPDRFHMAPEPDRMAAQQRYLRLNAAYQCLREPKDRLLHLLELELGSKPKATQPIAADTMELFMEVGALCRNVDAFLAEKSKVTSPLLKVRCFEKGMQWTEALNALRQKIVVRNLELNRELTALNAAWDGAPVASDESRRTRLPLARLEQIYRVFSYVARWTGQLEERLVQLAL